MALAKQEVAVVHLVYEISSPADRDGKWPCWESNISPAFPMLGLYGLDSGCYGGLTAMWRPYIFKLREALTDDRALDSRTQPWIARFKTLSIYKLQ
jgi:hypothetical protein